MCQLCDDKGVFKIGYRAEPDGYMDIVICICSPGMSMRRRGVDNVKRLLSMRYGVSLECVGLAEELLDAEDFPPSLAAWKPSDAVVDVTEAGRSSRKAKL